MNPFRRVLVVLALVLAALWPQPGAAQDGSALNAYRTAGVIAERFDGYVEVRAADAPSDVRKLVDEVNAKRRALYSQRARESDVSVEQVGKLFATKIVDTAPPGTYFLQPGGDYVRK